MHDAASCTRQLSTGAFDSPPRFPPGFACAQRIPPGLGFREVAQSSRKVLPLVLLLCLQALVLAQSPGVCWPAQTTVTLTSEPPAV